MRGFCRAAGIPESAKIEYASDPRKVDHVWIEIDCGERMRIAVNTLSLRNREAGFEARVRVGLIRAQFKHLPEPGVFPCEGLDYRALETTNNVFYEFYDQRSLEDLLLAKSERASFMEAWGEVYRHNHFGIHQVHCRWASCAVTEDIRGRDGALRFYFSDRSTEMLLFKFCGQE